MYCRLETAVDSLEVPPRTLGPDAALPHLDFGLVCSDLAFSASHHLIVFLSEQSEILHLGTKC